MGLGADFAGRQAVSHVIAGVRRIGCVAWRDGETGSSDLLCDSRRTHCVRKEKLDARGRRWTGAGEISAYHHYSGGKASPQFGADGDGKKLAAALGHTVVPLRPALVKLKCRSPYLKALSGCKVDAKASLLQGDEVLAQEWGEVLFTAEGLSGPPILRLSREALVSGRRCSIALNLMDQMREGERQPAAETACRTLWLYESAGDAERHSP